jgi:hypothetical protein
MDISLVIEQAHAYALKEISLYGTPTKERFFLSNDKWQGVAQQLWADENIVMLWTILMDLKIGECLKEGKLDEHITRSSQAAQEFLQQFDLDHDVLQKIIACIESHHGVEKYPCLEAEICANVDCYRFLHPRGFISAVALFGNEDGDLDNVLNLLESKIDEKYNALSLNICKQELEPYYQEFKKLITKSKI